MADKAVGDAAFAWLVASLIAMRGPAWQDGLWTWGPSLLMVATGLGFIAWDARRAKPVAEPGPAAPQSPPPQAALPAPAEPSPMPIGHGLYVGRVHVDTNRLERDFLLEFAFFAFNGGPALLRLAGMRRRIAYAEAHTVLEASWEMLPTPVIRDDNPAPFAAFGELVDRRRPLDGGPCDVRVRGPEHRRCYRGAGEASAPPGLAARHM